jgi:hypothetical protein
MDVFLEDLEEAAEMLEDETKMGRITLERLKGTKKRRW